MLKFQNEQVNQGNNADRFVTVEYVLLAIQRFAPRCTQGA